MKLSIPQDALLRAAKHAALAANSKATIPVMACALLRAEDGRLVVIGTSHSIATTAVVPCEVESPGAIAVNAGDLVKRIATLPTGMAHLTLRDNSLVIQSGARRHTLPTTEAESFPATPSHDAEWTKVPGTALRDGLSRVRSAASLDESRPALNGILVEQGQDGATFVTTDGHRLHLARADVKLSGGGILPLASAAPILDVLHDGDVEVAWAKDAVLVRSGVFAVRAKLVDAHFPPYSQVIPEKSPHVITVERADLSGALRAVDPAIGKSGGVLLVVSNSEIQVAASNDGAESSDVVPCEGGPADGVVKVSVNAKYLAEAMTAVGGTMVTFGINSDEIAPIVIRRAQEDGANDDRVTAVVMPMME